MKIAIYSGSFDPLTYGHLWVIEQARAISDEVVVLLGQHPTKTPMFSVSDRIGFLRSELKGVPGVTTDVMFGENVVEYANRVAKTRSASVTIVRGIRKMEDYFYEMSIHECMTKKDGARDHHFAFFVPPTNLNNVSSSMVKEAAKVGAWQHVNQSVPAPVASRLAELVVPDATPPLFSEFSADDDVRITGKNQFFPDDDGMSLQQIASSGFDWRRAGYVPYPELEDARHTFARAVDSGLVTFPQTVTKDQVVATLDTFPLEVAVSQTFHLHDIPVNCVRPIGERFVSCSRSFTPIIVDANVHEQLQHLGQVIVIEGKHRLLDAQERGEDTVKAYVGCQALRLLGIG